MQCQDSFSGPHIWQEILSHFQNSHIAYQQARQAIAQDARVLGPS